MKFKKYIIALPFVLALIALIVIAAQSSTSEEKIITGIIETTTVNVASKIPGRKEEFLRGNIHGAFYFPSELSRNIKSGKQSDVIMFIDASNLLISNSLLNDGAKILKTVNAGILLKKIKSIGMTEKQAINLVNPIKVESNILYNPNYSYITYLIPGLTTFILMMIVIMGAVPIINHKITESDFRNEL